MNKVPSTEAMHFYHMMQDELSAWMTSTYPIQNALLGTDMQIMLTYEPRAKVSQRAVVPVAETTRIERFGPFKDKEQAQAFMWQMCYDSVKQAMTPGAAR